MSDDRKIDPAAAAVLGIEGPITRNPPAPPPERPERRVSRSALPPSPDRDADERNEDEKPAKAAKGPTRGRPMDYDESDGYLEQGQDRRPLDAAEGNSFEIPKHLERRGWVYEWKTTAVYMQPVDPADTGMIRRQGWQPCTDRYIRAHFMPPGWEKDTIEQRGMMLYTRQARLNIAAAEEARRKADEQKISKLKAALAAPTDQPHSMPRVRDAFSIEGEIGAYGDDPIERRRGA